MFLLNGVRARHGVYSAVPLGGALTYHNPAILKQIDAQLENPQTHDLRFYIHKAGAEAKLSRFRAWFGQRVGRELNPFRELHEELVTEQGALPYLNRDDVHIQLADSHEARAYSDRPGIQTRETHSFREIFDVTITNRLLLDRLWRHGADYGVFWLNADHLARNEPLSWQGRRVKVQLAELVYPALLPAE